MKSRLPLMLLTACVLLALGLGLEGAGCAIVRRPVNPEADAGVLDLTGWNFATDGPIDLAGEWEFYWDRLLGPSEADPQKVYISGYMDLPRSWNGYVIDGTKIKAAGYATFGLTIRTVPDGSRISVRIPEVSTAYRLWVNGQELADNGKVGTTAKDTVSQYMPLIITFDNDRQEIRIVIQVSNFSHRRGGLWEPLEIGTEATLRQKAAWLMFCDLFGIGSLVTMAFYYFSTYVLRRKEKSYLYFAEICFVAGLRAMLVGDIVLTKVWPDFSWAFALRLEYLAGASFLPAALLFCKELYPEEVSTPATRASQWVAWIFSVIVMLVPTSISSQLIVPYQGVGAIGATYIIWIVTSAARHKREGALWLLFGSVLFSLALVNDALYYNGIIRTGSYSALALVAVCFAQSSVLSKRFTGALTSVEQLSGQLTSLNEQLTTLNRDLEARVEERTAALMDSNRRLEMSNREVERMEQSRKHLLTNIAHDLRTPVTLIQGYVEAMLDGVIDTPEQRNKYLTLIRGKTSGLSHLIEDLFELTQLESRRVAFTMRKVQIDELVSDLYAKYEADIVSAGVSATLIPATWGPLRHEKGPLVNVDTERIDRVVANLVYNALKFTPKGGRISMGCEPGPQRDPRGQVKEVVVSISDSGSGIAAEDLPYVFDRFYKAPRSRSHAPGSGLGLSIAKEVVELHGGHIWAESAPDRGTTFSFTLPVAAPAGTEEPGPDEQVIKTTDIPQRGQ